MPPKLPTAPMQPTILIQPPTQQTPKPEFPEPLPRSDPPAKPDVRPMPPADPPGTSPMAESPTPRAVAPNPLTIREREGEPPLAPPPGLVQHYTVKQGGEFLSEIARRTLGRAERSVELVQLNPTLRNDIRLVSGTVVRLPGDACIQPDEIDIVTPLPALKPVKFETVKPKVLMPLTGTFPCNLDDRRTLLLPKAIRDQLSSSEMLMVSPGPDHCLWLTNQEHLDRMAVKMEQSQAKEADVRTFKRLYFAQTEKVTMQDDGRVVISDRLAQFAGLHQEVVVVGIDDHFELWDVGRWKEFTQKKSAAARASMAAEQD
jgi:MraZ protein